MKTLTPKQQRFVDEYLLDLNATKAAERAGFSTKTARQAGTRLLSNVAIAAAITQGQMARATRTEITQDRVLQEIAALGFVDLGVLFSAGGLLRIEDLPEKVRRGITGMKVVTRSKGEGEVEYVAEVKTDKTANLGLLARHLGMLNDKLQVTDRLDLSKLSNETIAMMRRDLGLLEDGSGGK